MMAHGPMISFVFVRPAVTMKLLRPSWPRLPRLLNRSVALEPTGRVRLATVNTVGLTSLFAQFG